MWHKLKISQSLWDYISINSILAFMISWNPYRRAEIKIQASGVIDNLVQVESPSFNMGLDVF
jgi:hypothetical protein